MNSSESKLNNTITARSILRNARRICIKTGTAVVANENGRPSLTRLGAIAEQISELNTRGVEVILVSSGAVGMGKRLLRKQGQMRMSFIDAMHSHDEIIDDITAAENQTNESKMGRTQSFVSLLNTTTRPHTQAEKKKFYDSACAAAGQFDLMNLYSSLFTQCDVTASQVCFNSLLYLVDPQMNIKVRPIFPMLGFLYTNILFLNRNVTAIGHAG